MVKSLVSKLSSASSNLSIASTISSVTASVVNHGGPQDSSSVKHRNDPGRFFGDGVQFKAKLIGILEVGEARGDRMCQEALQDLKMAIRAAGEHKQRITIHVTIDGLRLRDEKTGDSLYHHPVHKISFIAQDMTDSRAFGYIFGSPDSGHRFFGIKTDKAASQVVLAMRDLFQVVFELKKKEIELARQQIQSKSIHEHQSLSSLVSLKATTGGASGHNDLSGSAGPSSLSMLSSLNASATGSSLKMGYNIGDAKHSFNNVKEMSPESVADLVDLEQELSSIQRGITQMERITPSDSTPTLGRSSNKTGGNDEDPFGDSFTKFPTYNLLPPPESSRSRSKPIKTSDSNATTTNVNNTNVSTVTSLISAAPIASNSPLNIQQEDDDSWLKELDQQSDVFDTSKTGLVGLGVGMSIAPLAPRESSSTPTNQLVPGANFDLSATSVGCAAATSASATLTTFNSEPSTGSAIAQGEQAQTSSLANAVKSESGPTGTETGGDSSTGTGDHVMLPRDTDPFSPTRKKSDPFQEGDIFANLDPFEFEFSASNESATTTSHQQPKQQRSTPVLDGGTVRKSSTDVFNGPLQVSLPPESGAQASAQQWKPLNESVGNNVARSRPSGVLAPGHLQTNASSAFKQQTADVISSISNKKMPHLFGQARFSKRDSNSINMRRLQESDSLSENESAPEPPPRPDSVSHVEPPPLPPKKQFSDIVIRPRGMAVSLATMSTSSVTTTAVSSATANRYEFLNSGLKLSSNTRTGSGGTDVPPIPLPSRRLGRSDGMYPGPGRPRKPGHTEDDYLAPISSTSVVSVTASSGSSSLPVTDVPPLLPPPTQTSTRARTQRQLSLQQGKSQEIYENKTEIIREQQRAEESAGLVPAIIPDITLSQLLTLGIDELSTKLNVPTIKLSTMTLVELTSYLSEFLEKSKPQRQQQQQHVQSTNQKNRETEDTNQSDMDEPVIFKVNFDQEATFVAKFDDNFGEVQRDAFVANFEQFNEHGQQHITQKSTARATSRTPAVPPADRYAVFREIIDQEMQQRQEDTDLLGDMLVDESVDTDAGSSAKGSTIDFTQSQDINSAFAAHFSDQCDLLSKPLQQQAPARIDTKITEVVAQAKDRYAALRDIILVENLFEKQPISISEQQLGQQPHVNLMSVDADFPEFGDEDQDLKQIMENDRASSSGFPAEASSSALTVGDDDDEEDDGIAESSLDSNEKDDGLTSGGGKKLAQDQYEKLSTSTQQLDVKDEKSERSNNLMTAKQDSKFLTVAGSSGLSSSKDDLEIDDLMQRAISNLSLDSRERSSPATAPIIVTLINDSTTRPKDSSPAFATTKSQFNDVSTSPMPLQKSPGTVQLQKQQKSLLQRKSPETSSIPTQLTAVSHLIDTASRQISIDQGSSGNSKESWATFDSPKTQNYMSAAAEKHRAHKRDRRSKSPKAITLHIPPPPPSNASQNDTAESPCSSDPRDERWSKNVRRWPKTDRAGGGGGGGGGSNAPQTSSSSRDLSPWDDELPDNYSKQRRGPTSQTAVGQVDHPHAHADRHGYYMRHARRMNSCDEDYDYDDVFSKRRDHRKFKQGISRSRDHFEFESSNWYHHPHHHTWSPQDEESSVGTSSRARSFDRSTYERTTYGPPIYDKRGIALPPVATHDRRSAGSGYDKRKYYRDYLRPMYDFDGYVEPLSQERRARRDYENVYDVDSRSPMGVGYSSKSRASEYLYERDRKSFDRESVESFDSATRRRRSFGSGDVYGSLESREEFCKRYVGVGLDPKETTRSLRKGGIKSRNTPSEIDYEQDSDINDFQHQRGGGIIRSAPLESRSLQRPNQLGSVGSIGGVGIQQRARKSSGSSPWDGDEPMPHMGAGSSIPAIPPACQKSWKRPSSAAESERRLAESRRVPVAPQALSGSDGEKDQRFRKKQRLRGKESTGPTTSRYCGSSGHSRENYDYMTYANDNDEEEDIDDDDYVDEEEYDDPPTDEDKFEGLNRRRQEMHQRMVESEHRRQQQHSLIKGPLPPPTTSALKNKGNKYQGSTRSTEFVNFDDFETSTPISRSGADSGVGGSDTVKSSNMTAAATTGTSTSATTKFTFDEAGGFESDFNQSSPPPVPAGTASSCNSTPAATISAASTTTAATKSSFRFSNDFSEREKNQQQHHFSVQNSTSISSLQQFDLDNVTNTSAPPHATPPITQKLRFDDNVKISKFDNDSHILAHADAFEDDFAKAEFDFEKEDQWSADALQTAATTAKKNHMRSTKLQQRQELIKKSESINIFGKKSEDPFEDDDFFNAPASKIIGNGSDASKVEDKMKMTEDNGGGGGFQWEDDNFAKFDENM